METCPLCGLATIRVTAHLDQTHGVDLADLPDLLDPTPLVDKIMAHHNVIDLNNPQPKPPSREGGYL